MKIIKKLKQLDMDEVSWEREYYPRSENCPNWQAVYQYQQAMRAGTKFPPILVGRKDNGYSIIDGVTRYEATKRLKGEKIYAYLINAPEKTWYEISVEINIVNGQRFSPYEVRTIVLKLRETGYDDEKISNIIKIPIESIAKLLIDSIVKVPGLITRRGKQLYDDKAIKKVIRHMAGQTVTNDVLEQQNPLYGWGQIDLLDQLIELLRDGLIEVDNPEIVERLMIITQMIGKMVNKVAA
mgnify:CR=1 FL=1